MNKCRSKLPALLLLAVIAACGESGDSIEQSPLLVGLGPHLAVSPNGTAVVSYIAPTDEGHALRYHEVRNGTWSAAQTVATGDNWFVNWADFPSVTPITDSLWAAHWLVRREAGGYAYDVHAAVSDNAGRNWSEPFLLHDDGTDTEHGFVTLFPSGEGVGAVWLDGRNMVSEPDSGDGHGSAGGMTLRSGRFDASGNMADSQVVDGLICDCCQTDVAISSEGPVAVYRDRTSDEIRDIYISHFVAGVWQGEHPVNNDNWNIAGCPVNGPVIKANGETVVVTWFTGALDKPTIKSAWSHDAGRSFAPPIVVSETNVIGYVGSALLLDDSIVASWVCKVPEAGNTICFQEVSSDGTLGPMQHLETHGVVSRMSVPQLARIDDQLFFVWTDRVEDQFRINSKFVPLAVR